jgi:hypothetical protein
MENITVFSVFEVTHLRQVIESSIEPLLLAERFRALCTMAQAYVFQSEGRKRNPDAPFSRV